MSANLEPPKMKPTLGLTGLTVNAMALIAPGAFLWLTLAQQCQYGVPLAAQDMWFGIVAALTLCFATAISYAELSKLYPGAGSSYFFAEQAFLSKTHAYKFARIAKFIIGWASHLYYWVYPGVMVGVTAILVGYIASQVLPETFNGSVNSPTLMIGFCIVFALGVSFIAYRGVTGTTGVNVAINVIQISALLVFSVLAISYRVAHDKGDTDVPGYAVYNGDPVAKTPQIEQEQQKDANGKPQVYAADYTLADGTKVKKGDPFMGNKLDDKGDVVLVMKPPQEPDLDEKGKPKLDKDGKEMTKDKLGSDGKALPAEQQYDDVAVNFKKDGALALAPSDTKVTEVEMRPTFHYFTDAKDVVRPHSFSTIIVQACIAILILVGFESVTSMGEEAKNAKRDIPRAVLLSLFIQGVICYLIQYFAALYFLNPAYDATSAAGSSAPVADMMLIIMTAMLGGNAAGAKVVMLLLAFTVFLALIGTTLSCVSTGARVTYAMGRDDEVPSHFGLLHGKHLTPHRAIWTLAIISAVLGIVTVSAYLCGPATPANAAAYDKAVTDAVKDHPFWYPSFLTFSSATAAKLPNSLLVMTLVSNFGTFLLYMLTNIIAIVAFKEHHSFHGFKHMVVPVFGLIANLVCMLFYLLGPLPIPGIGVEGMSFMEPYCALAIAAVWGIYGWFYFISSSKSKGRATLITAPEGKLAAGAAK